MLYNQADAFATAPSHILGLKTPWGQYQLDLVTVQVGREIEKGLLDGKSIESLLSSSPKAKGDYAPLKGMAMEKVKMVNGVW